MLLNFHDYRAAAKRRLPRFLFDYIDRGTEDETGPRRHRSDLDAISLLPEMLTGHDQRDLTTTVFGRTLALPVAVAPTALAGLVAYDGELMLARGVAHAGVPYCISTQSVTTVERIREAAPNANLWFQLYVWRNRDLTRGLLQRAAACGITTLVVTADTPVLPNREYNLRNGLTIPLKPGGRVALDLLRHPGWTLSVLLGYLRQGGMPVYGHYPEAFRNSVARAQLASEVAIDHRLNWDDIASLRRDWAGELVVKGLLSVADARRAADLGAEGVVVSTHGARNLDSAITTARALPPIVDAVGGRVTVLADSCVQRGSDVVKYMGLGARAVLLGRAPLWGLAAGGEPGLRGVLSMLGNEIDLTLALLGRARLEKLETCIAREGDAQ
ncbi:MAG: alpha-hydroxy acid oxidase [Gemmobacter sp.]|nr:alpha-hydroxy acid oxidase [Gemmobacter sp.]